VKGPAGPTAFVSASKKAASIFLYVIVPVMVPDGPSTPSGTSHSNFHVPGKYSSKLKSGCSSLGRVGRPRSGIWLFGSCGLSGGCGRRRGRRAPPPEGGERRQKGGNPRPFDPPTVYRAPTSKRTPVAP